MKTITILNDTSSFHAGCALVMSTINYYASMYNWEIIERKTSRDIYKLSELLPSDLIIVNGEGTIHDSFGHRLIEAAQNRKAVLINTVYQDCSFTHDEMKKFKLISVRESRSSKELHEIKVDNKIVPDLSFAYTHSLNKEVVYKAEGVLITGSSHRRYRGEGYRLKDTIPDCLEKFLRSQSVCSGRFHGATIAALLGKPFSCFPPNSHKTLGMLEDMGIGHLYFETQTEALDNIPEVLSNNVKEYVIMAREKIATLFAEINSLI